jgi:hypothetical protein
MVSKPWNLTHVYGSEHEWTSYFYTQLDHRSILHVFPSFHHVDIVKVALVLDPGDPSNPTLQIES